jgi:hypothetical protein
MNFSELMHSNSMMIVGTIVTIIVCGILGAIYFVPNWIRNRSQRSSSSSDDGGSDRRRKGGGGRSKGRALPSGERMNKNALTDVWKRFMGAQPWNFRGRIREYPQTLVLGPAGTGKSQLIDSQIDWQAQKKRFFPSITDDALVQIWCAASSTCSPRCTRSRSGSASC